MSNNKRTPSMDEMQSAASRVMDGAEFARGFTAALVAALEEAANELHLMRFDVNNGLHTVDTHYSGIIRARNRVRELAEEAESRV